MTLQIEAGGASKYDGFEAGSSGLRDELSEKVTSFACQVLETTHALKEFASVYVGFEEEGFMVGLMENLHIQPSGLAKMQKRVNILKDRVIKLQGQDPRVKKLFNQMVEVGIKDSTPRGGLKDIKASVYDLINECNIVDAGPFKKHGTICIKKEALPNVQPINVITESELIEMKKLRDRLFDPEGGVINIQGGEDFILEVKGDLDKMLAFEEGRIIIRKLCEHKKNLIIKQGAPQFKSDTNQVLINNDITPLIGFTENVHISIPIPRWITLSHELIHAVHNYDDPDMFKQNVCDDKACGWSNEEEYLTIGDPEKEIDPLSENGLRKNTLHLLRKYHKGGVSKQGDLASDMRMCELDGDFIRMMRKYELSKNDIFTIFNKCAYSWSSALASELLDHKIGREVIKHHLQVFFLNAKVNKDQNILDKIALVFPDAFTSLNGDQNTDLFVTLIRKVGRRIIFPIVFSEDPKVIKFGIEDIDEHIWFCISNIEWSSDIVNLLIENDIAKEGLKENFTRIFNQAIEQNDIDFVRTMFEKYPDEAKKISAKDIFEGVILRDTFGDFLRISGIKSLISKADVDNAISSYRLERYGFNKNDKVFNALKNFTDILYFSEAEQQKIREDKNMPSEISQLF
jgi:hypothetical protein